MALISCPECAKKISSLAPHCPQCGCPVLASISKKFANKQIVTTQQTSKQYKMVQVVSTLLIFLSIFLGISGGNAAGLAAPCFFLGVIGCIYAKMGAWWNNG